MNILVFRSMRHLDAISFDLINKTVQSMVERVTKKRKVQKYIRIFCISFMCLVLILTMLRLTKKVIRIGNAYSFSFSNELLINENHNVHDDNVDEIVYFENLQSLSISNTNITKMDFLMKLDELEFLNVVCSAECPVINIPSLKYNKNLEYVSLINVEIENLDIFAELEKIEMLTIAPINTEIYDISGIKNLHKLRYLSLNRVKCQNLSIIFEMSDLEYLKINNGVLTQEEIEALEKKGVEVRIS